MDAPFLGMPGVDGWLLLGLAAASFVTTFLSAAMAMGHVVEVRSAVELAYRFSNRARLGLELYHLSNAGLDDRNPGANVLMLTYSVPLGPPSR